MEEQPIPRDRASLPLAIQERLVPEDFQIRAFWPSWRFFLVDIGLAGIDMGYHEIYFISTTESDQTTWCIKATFLTHGWVSELYFDMVSSQVTMPTTLSDHALVASFIFGVEKGDLEEWTKTVLELMDQPHASYALLDL